MSMQTTIERSSDTSREKPCRKGWIDNWDPENESFWQNKGRRIAGRNLIFSIFAEHLGFSVWLLWSIVAVNLKKAGFDFTTSELFWLVAAPNLVGAFLRLPYTFAVTRFGGRNWTVFSALMLLVPTVLLAAAVSNPHTPYWAFLLIAASAGVGGGNFASSMTNISFFYPERRKGAALGINAAGGNVGVSVVQFCVPLLILAGGGMHLERAGYMWGILSIIAAIFAWHFMDNLSVARSSFKEQAAVVAHKHTWIMAVLYIGTFGSFIGYSAAMPLLIKTQFPGIVVANFAFLGPLVGSLARPLGGWLSDRIGGATVTFWSFLLMACGVGMVIAALQMHDFGMFLSSFMLLFTMAGVGNGSTYRMIPAIFQNQPGHGFAHVDRAQTLIEGRRLGAAAVGICSSIGAFGGFLIPLSYGLCGVVPAFYAFLAFYGLCLGTTWWHYKRKRFLVRSIPNLAAAEI